ncbi:MAG: hypothetical protein U0930_16460 [Pirellulales bacterium]
MFESMPETAWQCHVDTSRRIVLPVALCQLTNIHCGDDLVASVENGLITLRTYEEAMQRLQDAYCSGLPQGTGSLVDELIAERRAEGGREAST